MALAKTMGDTRAIMSHPNNFVQWPRAGLVELSGYSEAFTPLGLFPETLMNQPGELTALNSARTKKWYRRVGCQHR
jgi:hypothetical protein